MSLPAAPAPGPAAPQQQRLEAFLTDAVGERVAVTELQRISSVGNAREPWSFTATWDGQRTRCVMLVKAAAGQLETTLRPEFDTIAAMHGQGVPVARALWCDDTDAGIGAAFFVTEWVPGSADTRLLRRAEGVDQIRAVALQLAQAAARLHQLDVAPFGHLNPTTTTEAAATQLGYWAELFQRQRMEAHPALVYAVTWLQRHLPRAQRVSVVHGDLRFGNVLYDGDRLTALLDWEMTHLGDPIEDLGWVYRSLWSPERALPFSEFLAAYRDAGGGEVDPQHLRWYQVFAEVKHSVISLTGTRSFAERSTTSLRHADRAATVVAFTDRVLELLAPC